MLNSFTVRRVLKADRCRIFEAFSDADLFSCWFKPDVNVSIEVLAFEFVEGGIYRLRYTMPNQAHPVLFGTYQTIVRPEKLVFSWEWEEPDPHAGVLSLVEILLVERGKSTEVIVTHGRIPSEEIAAGHKQGWNGALDCLVQLLAQSDSCLKLSKDLSGDSK